MGGVDPPPDLLGGGAPPRPLPNTGPIQPAGEEKQRGTLRESEHQAAGYQYSLTDKEVFEEVSSRLLSQFKYTARDIVQESTAQGQICGCFFCP